MDLDEQAHRVKLMIRREPSTNSTARTGGGKYVPDDIRFQIL